MHTVDKMSIFIIMQVFAWCTMQPRIPSALKVARPALVRIKVNSILNSPNEAVTIDFTRALYARVVMVNGD